MSHGWKALLRLTGGQSFRVERVRLPDSGISIEGDFEVPPMATLADEDQVFLAAFVRAHGSIKQMEQVFGISYPTVKNRLNRIGEKLDFVAVDVLTTPDPGGILERLERGEIEVGEALRLLKEGERDE